MADMLRLAMTSGEPPKPGQPCRMQGYRVHVHITPSKGGKRGSGAGGQASLLEGKPTLSYWCFAPGTAMQELAALKVNGLA